MADGLVALRERQKSQRFLNGELIGRQAVGDTRRIVTTLDVGPVFSGFRNNFIAVVIETDGERVDTCRIDLVEVVFDEPLQTRQGVVTEVKASQPVGLLSTAACNIIEVLFDLCGKRIVDEIIKVIFE